MKCAGEIFGPVLGLLCVCSVAAPAVHAQCGVKAKKTSFAGQPFLQGGQLIPASLPQAAEEQWSGPGGRFGLEPIVGLWKVSIMDKSKNYSDTSYVVWHSDFTEFENSERVPSTGAVCQGVWEKIGRSTYRLNHFAIGYADSLNLTNIIRIQEQVTVDKSGQSYSGTFVEDVCDTSHNCPANLRFTGPVSAKRVTLDSDINSQ